MKSKNWMCSAVGLIVAVVSLAPLPMLAQGKHGGGGGGGGSTSTSCSGKGGQSFNVTSNILGTTSDPFQLLSDGKGTYSTYKNSRTDSGTSEIQGVSCEWVLDLSNSTSRSVQLSMLDPVSSGEPLPSGWPTDGSFVSIPARIITGCEANSANTNGSTYGLSVGNMNFGDAPLQCGLWIKFYSNGTVYGISMNAFNYDGATWAQVTCEGGVSANGSPCKSWAVTPGLDKYGNTPTNPSNGLTTAIGELMQPSCDGCSSGTPLGLYYVNFSAIITNP
jgi:hypothetical protein